MPAGFGALCVVVFNVEANLMHAELRGGMCSTTAYVLANTVVQIPSMFALAMCVTVPAYGKAPPVQEDAAVAAPPPLAARA